MPIFRSGETPPVWCALRYFEIVRLETGASHVFERNGPHELLVIGAGACRLEVPEPAGPASGAHVAEAAEKGRGEFKFRLDGPAGRFAVAEALEPVTLVRLCGDWQEVAGFGVFAPRLAGDGPDWGDPVSYPKTTSFDNHFHDCDEYWIVYEGRGVTYSEGGRFEVAPGDCIATGMGHHHDFSEIHEPVRAVFFESAPEGERRKGHLWEHTHGPAKPQPGRG